MTSESRSEDRWRADLRAAVAFHDLTLSSHEFAGGQESEIDRARLAALNVVDRAMAAGVSEADIDAELAAYRKERADAAALEGIDGRD